MIERQWLIERLRDIDWLTEILLIGIGIWLIQRFDWLIQRFDWWFYLWTSLININLHWLIDHNWYNWLIYCLILIDCVILIDWYDWLILIDWEIAWYWLIQRLRDVDWLIDWLIRDCLMLIDREIAWHWLNERLLDIDWFSDCVMLIDWLIDWLRDCLIFKDWLWSRCLQWYGRTVPLPVWLESSADSETRLAPEIICSFGFYTMKTRLSSATCPWSIWDEVDLTWFFFKVQFYFYFFRS